MGEVVSEEVDVEFKVVRVVHRRKKYKRGCTCKSEPIIKVAAAPVKLFKNGLYSTDFWTYVIFDKYHLQRPTNRTLKWFESFNLNVPQGAIINGLKRLHKAKVFAPLIEAIRLRVVNAKRQQSDETGWKVFQQLEDKEGYQHWLWVTLIEDACYFRVDPTRSRKVAQAVIGDAPVVITTDRFSSYFNLGDNVTNSWCWAHVRREFLKIANFKGLKALSQSWVERVDKLYHLNKLRLAAKGEKYQELDSELRDAVREFERQLKSSAKRTKNADARNIFKNLAKDWAGLIVFVELPQVPMDNNASERVLRNPVVGRKCYYGSGALWAADFAADMFTLFSTLELNGLNPRTWLREYLQAVANNNCSAPTNAANFLPWNSPPLEALHS
jgi:transposase